MKAIEIMSSIPTGCVTHQLNREGGMHEPHLHIGETVVINPNDRTIINGELYLVQQTDGPIVWQLVRRDDYKWDGEGALYSLAPINRPGSFEELEEWMARGRAIYTGDGPVDEGYLAGKIVGRVVGVFDAQFSDRQIIEVAAGELRDVCKDWATA